MTQHATATLCCQLLLAAVGGFFCSTASAQQDWSGHYPRPVRVAPVTDFSASEMESRRRPASPPPAAQGRSGKRSKIAPTSHVEPSSNQLRAIEHGEIWQEMPITEDTGAFATAAYLDAQAPPHRVIRAPQQQSSRRHTGAAAIAREHTARVGSERSTEPIASAEARHRFAHHHHLPRLPGVANDPSAAGPGQLGVGTHWLRSAPRSRPRVPRATVQPSWKAPYSYGYFGSQGKRHWTRQNGYRDRYLQWTLR